MDGVVRILIVDDHRLVRDMLGTILDRESRFEVVAIASEASEALRIVRQSAPDVVVMDIDMPGLASFEAARAMREASETTRILFLSAFCHDSYIDEALRCGAAGYLTKNESPEAIANAIHAVSRGESAFSREVQSRIVIDRGGARLAGGRSTRLSTLTPRELEILRYIAQGLAQKEIALLLEISPRTVHCHTSNLMTKLEIHDRVELSRFAIREGIANP